jgi:hypothetical protein
MNRICKISLCVCVMLVLLITAVYKRAHHKVLAVGECERSMYLYAQYFELQVFTLIVRTSDNLFYAQPCLRV